MKKNSLQKAINGAFRYALHKQHEFISVEHLLLAMLHDCEVAMFLNEQGVSIGAFHRELVDCIRRHTPVIGDNTLGSYSEQRRTRPTQGFERVLQRASFLAECSGNSEVSTPHALLAIFAEHDSFARFVLEQHAIKRADIAEYVEHRRHNSGYRVTRQAI